MAIATAPTIAKELTIALNNNNNNNNISLYLLPTLNNNNNNSNRIVIERTCKAVSLAAGHRHSRWKTKSLAGGGEVGRSRARGSGSMGGKETLL